MMSTDRLHKATAKTQLCAVSTLLAWTVLWLVLPAPQAAQAQTFTVLYSFQGSDGDEPRAGVIRDSAGTLYGTTYSGGDYGYGVVFKIDKPGKETVLYSFTGGMDGANPYGGLVLGADGNLYGTTETGGYPDCIHDYGCGTVFKIDTQGQYSVLYRFGAMPDGSFPDYVTLLPDNAGNLYGTTASGGDSNCNPGWGCGTVFKLDKAGRETILHTFRGTEQVDGAYPYAGLVPDKYGNLYGTTSEGGAPGCSRGCGTVFKVNRAGKETVLHRFSGWPISSGPVAAVIRDDNGNLYGVLGGYTPGNGELFKLNKRNQETVLYSFAYGDGFPGFGAGLLRDAKGNLYGTTIEGNNYEGTVFKLDRSGTMTILHAFSGRADGGFPMGTLIMDEKGNLYGIARDGGNSGCYSGCGVVFEITP